MSQTTTGLTRHGKRNEVFNVFSSDGTIHWSAVWTSAALWPGSEPTNRRNHPVLAATLYGAPATDRDNRRLREGHRRIEIDALNQVIGTQRRSDQDKT